MHSLQYITQAYFMHKSNGCLKPDVRLKQGNVRIQSHLMQGKNSIRSNTVNLLKVKLIHLIHHSLDLILGYTYTLAPFFNDWAI